MKKNLFLFLLLMLPLWGHCGTLPIKADGRQNNGKRIIAATAAARAEASYQVSTEVQKKNVLLEEFTGVSCNNCPEGHRLAEELKTILGSRMNNISIQYGDLARPDHVTGEGKQIGDLLQPSAFPYASINRHNWNNDTQYSFGRGSWTSFSKRAFAEDAPVNLWGQAEYNSALRQMTIHVEGYFTSAVESSLRMSVLMIQDNIISGQSTSHGYDPQYVHSHVLRASVNGALGEMIEGCAEGSYFEKDYTYHVPANIVGLDVNPTDLSFIVVVSGEDGRNVKNSITIKPEYPGENMELKADIKSDIFGVTDGYQFRFLPIDITNRSNKLVSAADFDITLNGNTVAQQWHGELKPFERKVINVPIDWSAADNAGTNSYSVTLTKLNGKDIKTRPSFSGTFACPIVSTDAKLTVKIMTSPDSPDGYRYRIYDMDGNVVKEFGPYTTENTAYEESVSLYGETMYCMEVYSKWKEGYIPDYVMQLCNEDGSAAASINEITKCFSRRVFFKTGVGAAAEKVTLSVTSGEGGQVSLKNETVRGASKDFECNKDEQVEITITPDAGYQLKSVMAGTEDKTSSVAEGKLTIKMSAATAINVTFEQKPAVKHVLTVTSGEGGRIMYNGEEYTSEGEIKVAEGEKITLAIVPDMGYSVTSVTFNGSDVTGSYDSSTGMYTTPAITADATLDITFSNTTGITAAGGSAPGITIGEGKVTISGIEPSMHIDIFDMQGAKIERIKPQSDKVTISLARGKAYIVNISGRSYKISL